jgi:DNA replication and repair protein RecF
LHVTVLSTVNFRNLGAHRITWRRGVNLIVGDNGQGKSNLLEALTVLANLRSFRGARWQAMVRHGEMSAMLGGEVRSAEGVGRRLEQTVALGRPLERRLLIGKQPVSAQDYLWTCPVFALSGDERELLLGAPARRRVFLDRFAFLLDTRTLEEVRAYQRALAQRNAALRGSAADVELAAWEERLAAAAAAVVCRRRATTALLQAAFPALYDACRGETFPAVDIAYGGEAWLDTGDSPQMLEESYRKRYNMTRARDRRAGFTAQGPHRHDLLLTADGRPAKEVLSSGQSKVVATALRLATVTIVEDRRGQQFPVVIDDVDAELDSRILARVSAWLGSGRQVFLSSARPEAVTPLFPDPYLTRVRNGIVISQ